MKMMLQPYGNAANQIKAAYKKFVMRHLFEFFYKITWGGGLYYSIINHHVVRVLS